MRPTRIRDRIMKKILTFVIMALLLGGFTFNAVGQEKKARKSYNLSPQTKSESLLKEYEQTVDRCVSLFADLQKSDKTAKDSSKEFDQALTKAEDLKAQIEKIKSSMSRSQIYRFTTANEKLSKVYIK